MVYLQCTVTICLNKQYKQNNELAGRTIKFRKKKYKRAVATTLSNTAVKSHCKST